MVSRFAWEAIGHVGAGRMDSHVSTAHSHRSPGKEGSWGLGRRNAFEIRSENLYGD